MASTDADSQRYHAEGYLLATSPWLCCWDCYETDHLGVLQRSWSSQTRWYLWVIFCRSRWTSKESAGLKVVYVLALSQDLQKSINKLPLVVHWSYLRWKTPNIDLEGIHKESRVPIMYEHQYRYIPRMHLQILSEMLGSTCDTYLLIWAYRYYQ